MAARACFDTVPGFETEIFQSKRFGRLRLGTGEIIPVSLAARMIYLLKTNHSYQCIPCHIRTEWNLEIDKDTIRAVIEKDFEVTLEVASGGEYAIPVHPPPINKEGYVREHIIPAGIAYECINLRGNGLEFIGRYVKTRWGLEIGVESLATLINDWSAAIARTGQTAPEDARPRHDGRRINELAVRVTPEVNTRSSFAVPPPTYEPRPVFRNSRGQEIILRHPRELDASLPQGFRAAYAPTYTAGAPAPRYVRDSNNDIIRPESSSGGIPPRTMAEAGIPEEVPASATTMDELYAKPAHFAEDDVVLYSKKEVANCLFFNMPTIYPENEFEPLTMDRVSPEFRRYLTLVILGRMRSLQPADLFAEHVLGQGSRLTDAGHRLATLVKGIFGELAISVCARSRQTFRCITHIENCDGLFVMLEHLRLARGDPEIGDFKPPIALYMAVIEELQLSDNVHVKQVMRTYSTYPVTVRNLTELLVAIADARRADQSFSVVVQQLSIPTPRLHVSVPGVWSVASGHSLGELEGDTESAVATQTFNRYILLLTGVKDLLRAAVGATTHDGFAATRTRYELSSLDKHSDFRGGAKLIGIGTPVLKA
ncbi:hypothetical protein LTR72_004981 [Exophiala xenobiotica]|nr:hypothetical protein LTR72_004981 [Exophiala xenobiotica]KAK5286665.1 hypothetical protein LTR14_009732 [Exophiala xenobiotica]KAK5499890.1 hypothetical protein LTR55_000713 [Exophiala xenobiotica]